MTLDNGKVSVLSNTDSTTPTDDNHLCTKAYVDDKVGGGYPSEPFDQNGYSYDLVGNRMRVDNELMINGTVSSNSDYVGISLYSPNAFDFNKPGMHGSFSYHIPTGDVSILQGTGIGAIDTYATFSGGNITVTSGTGANTAPTEPNHLCNKTYVDGVLLAATGRAAGWSGTYQALNGDTITVSNGLIISVDP